MMSSYKARQEKHEKAKKFMKWEFDGYLDEAFDQHVLRVCVGFGKESEVHSLVTKYLAKMSDTLTLLDVEDYERWINFNEPRAGSIGLPSYKKIQCCMYFLVKDEVLSQEVAELIEEENWSKITEMFGGKII